MRKLSRRAASIALAAAMLFTTAGVSQKKVEAASTGKLSVTGYQDYNDAQKILKEVNKYRKKNGRKALKMDRGLTNSAIMRGFETTIYIPETSPHRRPNGKLSKSINKKIIYENCAQSAETTPNDDTSDREIQCAACGNISKQRNWFLSRIGTHYVICPKCGTLRYVCHNNAGYRKE